ncbi:hypothetical protein M0802_014663 [Mischocyttarus mexicanus]|nr:hypothetical protein M0802_014666 [Mischocyttarus mexicanus]KAI4477775.1 hypothetical protein M0802_014663 [Mischocyttarus mexicanus]
MMTDVHARENHENHDDDDDDDDAEDDDDGDGDDDGDDEGSFPSRKPRLMGVGEEHSRLFQGSLSPSSRTDLRARTPSLSFSPSLLSSL